MARFDVYRFADDLVLDCQSDVHSHFNTRFVVPMRDASQGYPVKQRLNPAFDLDGARVIMLTEFASTVRVRQLGERVGSLAHHHDVIVDALDFLMSGY